MSFEAHVDFKNFATKRSAIFIITSPTRTIQYNFANMLFGIAIKELLDFADTQESHRLPRPVRLFFDDFSCGFPIQNFEKSISIFRSAGISSMMLCQSLSQLDATYGEENSSIILDNCSTLAYLPGSMNTRTCSYFGKLLDMTLDQVAFMKMGNIVILRSGVKPQIVKRYDTLNDPFYQRFLEVEKRQKQNSLISR